MSIIDFDTELNPRKGYHRTVYASASILDTRTLNNLNLVLGAAIRQLMTTAYEEYRRLAKHDPSPLSAADFFNHPSCFVDWSHLPQRKLSCSINVSIPETDEEYYNRVHKLNKKKVSSLEKTLAEEKKKLASSQARIEEIEKKLSEASKIP